MPLLPLFLDLSGKRVLIVGGGSVARAKWEVLEPTGCAFRVVARAFHAGFAAELDARRAERSERGFAAADLDGVNLVVAATNDPSANAELARLARARGVWINAVDDPAACDVQFASILRRGPLVAALSTGGGFPGLSRLVREALEALLPDPALPELEALVQLRREIRRLPDPAFRSAALAALVRDVRATLSPLEPA